MIKITEFFKRISKPHIIVDFNIITKVCSSFTSLTGYDSSELLFTNVDDVIQKLLRSKENIYKLHFSLSEFDCFLFTKANEVREITVYTKVKNKKGRKEYYFIEKPATRIEEKFIFYEQQFIENDIGIAVYSVPNLILLKANDKQISFFEKPYDTANYCIGRPLSEISSGFVGGSYQAIWDTILTTQKTMHLLEQNYENCKEKIRYWDTTISPVFDKGEFKYIIETCTDVTSRVRSNLELRRRIDCYQENKKSLEDVIETLSEGVIILSEKGESIICNKAARNIFEYEEGSSNIDENLKDIEYYDENDNRIYYSDMPHARVMRGEAFEGKRYRLRFHDKTMYICVSGTPIYNCRGKFVKGIISIIDITNQIKSEQMIRVQNEKLDIIVKNMSGTLIIIDKYGYIIRHEVNLATEADLTNIFDISDFYRSGEFFDEDGKVMSIQQIPIYRVWKGESINDIRYTYKVSDVEYHFSSNGRPVYDDNGEFLMGIVYGHDITDRVKAEKIKDSYKDCILRKEKKHNEVLEETLRMKEEFLTFLSHEFKTPITVINSAIQALEVLCPDELSDKSHKYISKIRQNSLRQLRLVNNILDISRVRANKVKLNMANNDLVYMTKAIIESVHLYAQQKGIDIAFESDLTDLIISIDDEKYERILLNILSNAIKFTPYGNSIEVKLFLEKESVCLEVKDHGVGIEEDKINAIFEHFGMVESCPEKRAESSGVGLSLVKLFTEVMGGRIAVQSKLGEGTIFTVILPAIRGEFVTSKDELKNVSDSKILNAAAIEFSDIYLK